MLDFVNHYYEVTKENVSLLRQMMKAEDIQHYDGSNISVDEYVIVGRIIGNNRNNNPKCTGLWFSTFTMSDAEFEKVTTELPNQLMTIE